MTPQEHTCAQLSPAGKGCSTARRRLSRGALLAGPLAGAAFALCLLVPVVSAQPASEGLVVVSDFGIPVPKVRVFDPENGRIVYDYALPREDVEDCNKTSVVCTPLGVNHISYADNDYLDMALMIGNPLGGSLAEMTYSIIQRVMPIHPSVTMWMIKELDWRGVPNADAYCAYEPDNICGVPRDPRCRMNFAHAFDIIDDRPEDKTVSLVVADTAHARVLSITLDYHDGNSCGQVDWALGSDHPDWPPDAIPNAVQYLEEPDGQYLLVTFYNANDDVWGGGQLKMWKWNSGEWELVWTFPEPSLGPRVYLNTPHMGKVIEDPATGERRIWYSHSRGTAADWGTYNPDLFGGTFGMLEPGDTLAAPPSYLFDAVLHTSDPDYQVHFSRDQQYLPDGTLLFTDAACETICSYEPVIFRVDRIQDESLPSSKQGNFTRNHGQLEMLDVRETDLLAEYRCGFVSLFESAWIPPDRVGSQLRTAAQTSGMSCPE